MTEQEFRDALKRQIGQSGLSFDRQDRVLARIGKEEKKVRVSSKVRIGVILALVLVMGMGAAVAAGSLYVGWDGKGVTPEPIYEWDSSMDDKAAALASERPDHEAWRIGWPMTETENGGAMFFGEAQITFRTLDEAAELLSEDAYLPWIKAIPDGYSYQRGYATYRPLHSYERIGEENLDGLNVERARIPEDQRRMCRYSLTFANEAEQEMYVTVYLDWGDGTGRVFTVGEGGSAKRLVLNGMKDALLTKQPNGTTGLSAHKMLSEPVHVIEELGIFYPDWDQYIEFGSIYIGVGTTDDSLTEDDLLAVFALTPQ